MIDMRNNIKMNSLLCCYFPTKVIVVDDDRGVLEGLESLLNDEIASYDFFTDPYEALELISSSKITDFINSHISSPEARIYEMYKAMYNPQRHEEISTVIVDFQMPHLNGLEFCKEIKNPYVRKILYTGVAEEDLAIQAFNTGLIDGYIKKQDPNKAKIINEFVYSSQIKYFKTLTDVLVGTVFKELISTNPKETAFYDPVFIKYFNELSEKHQICEYYLNEMTGGFICLSAKGEVSTLFTYTDETLEHNQINTYSVLEDVINSQKLTYSQLIKDIDDNQKTICFPFYGKLLDITSHNWKNHVHSLEKIRGNQTYHVAYVKHPGAEKELNLYSFEQFQRDR